jgi:hypothetical protein
MFLGCRIGYLREKIMLIFLIQDRRDPSFHISSIGARVKLRAKI